MYCSSHENRSSFFLGYLPFFIFLRTEKVPRDRPKNRLLFTGIWLSHLHTHSDACAFMAKTAARREPGVKIGHPSLKVQERD